MLARTDHYLTTRCDKALRKKRSSLPEWQVLSMLSDNAGHSMSEIARSVLMPAPSLTKLVNQMASRQLVYRRADQADRRRVLIFLSARGRAAHHRLRQTVDASMDGFDDQLLRDLAEELASWIGPQVLGKAT
jgi:MarR family transcriptional regulator, organic hydroperoxide resistance regulator